MCSGTRSTCECTFLATLQMGLLRALKEFKADNNSLREFPKALCECAALRVVLPGPLCISEHVVRYLINRW